MLGIILKKQKEKQKKQQQQQQKKKKNGKVVSLRKIGQDHKISHCLFTC